MKNMTINLIQKNSDFGKGAFVWDSQINDFLDMTLLGQKHPSKKDGWEVKLELENNNVLEKINGQCNYQIARIIQIFMQELEDCQQKLKKLEVKNDKKERRKGN